MCKEDLCNRCHHTRTAHSLISGTMLLDAVGLIANVENLKNKCLVLM